MAAAVGLVACGGGNHAPQARERPAAAQTPIVTVQRIVGAGLAAGASFEYSKNDCDRVSVDVFARIEQGRTGGPPTETRELTVQVNEYSVCDGSFVVAFGPAQAPGFAIASDLSAASAMGTATPSDDFGNDRAVSFNLQWSGGVLSTSPRTRDVFVTPTLRLTSEQVGALRSDPTVTGTLVVDGFDFLAPANASKVAVINTFISSYSGRTTEITRTRPPTATVERRAASARHAYAEYFQIGVGGCERLDLEVFARDGIVRTRGAPTDDREVLVQLRRENTCSGEISVLQGTMTAPSVVVARDLLSASVRGTAAVSDGLGGPASTVSVDLRWAGGTLSESPRTRDVFTSPTSRLVVTGTSAYRQNDSVTGSLVLDGFDLLSPGNATELSFIVGRTLSSSGSSIQISFWPQ